MSIIDQASAESSRRYNADMTDPKAEVWRRDTRAAFVDGVRWLLDQLQDPMPETMATCVEAFRFHLVEWVPGEHAYDKPKYACVCGWSVDADCADGALLAHRLRAAITALTNHLGADHE
jgi:hypothetical protein